MIGFLLGFGLGIAVTIVAPKVYQKWIKPIIGNWFEKRFQSI